MADEILEKSASAGAIVSGGVGGVTDPAAGVLDNTNPKRTGLTGELAFDTSSDTGILRPEQSRQFIEYLWDNTLLARDGRRVVMQANTMELEKMHVGERLARAAAQADATYTNADVAFTKIELKTTKIRLDWEVSTEALEDNIEGSSFEDHLVRTMTGAFAIDLEDLAINGDGTTSPFLSIMEGFVKKEKTGTEATVDATGGWKIEHFQAVLNALPRKFRAIRPNLKFYVGTDTYTDFITNVGQYTNTLVQQVVGNYIDGTIPQTVGAPVSYRVLGIAMQEVPLYPADYVSLTFPNNRIWGFQRDVTVHREFQPKKDTIEYTVYVRFGVQMEETDAVAWADANASDAS